MPDLRAEHRVLFPVVLLTTSLFAQPASAPAGVRERAVLEVLREATAGARYGSFFWELRSVPDPAGRPPRPMPRLVGLCGNSITGWVSEPVLRGHVARLFQAFGLPPATNAACDVPDVPTVFDVVCAQARVAVKLDGEIKPGAAGLLEGPVDEPGGPLTPDQRGKLAAAGWRVLCVPLEELCLLDQDQVCVLLPFLGRVVELLNGATAGEDVDVAPLVHGWEQRFDLTPIERTPLPPGMRYVAPTAMLEVTAAGKLSWHVQGAAEVRDHPDQNRWRRLSTPGAAAGQVTLVALRVTAAAPASGPGSGLLLRLTQGSLALSSTTPQILVPAGFDAGRPFTLTAEFAPGSYQVFPQVSVAALR